MHERRTARRRFPRRLASLLIVGAVATTALVTAAGSSAATTVVNTAPPAVSGVAQAGQTLTATNGTWSGVGTITFTTRWQRCSATGTSCADISGATASTYVLTSADVGNTVRAVVTAKDSNDPAEAASAPTAKVADASDAGASAVDPPNVQGTLKEGSTLTAGEGTFAGAGPLTYTYAWLRCAADGGECAAIASATAKTYVITAADLGKTLRVRVTASNPSGAATATSVPTAVIPGAAPASLRVLSDGTRSIAASDVTGAERLILDGYRYTPRPVRSRAAIKATFHVSDTRGYSVRDSIVYVIGIPYNRVGTLPELRTDDHGNVTFTLRPTTRFPLNDGARLVLFARARVEGQQLLAGASARRLVEIRVSNPSLSAVDRWGASAVARPTGTC